MTKNPADIVQHVLTVIGNGLYVNSVGRTPSSNSGVKLDSPAQPKETLMRDAPSFGKRHKGRKGRK
jgi:hypothetical protein